MQARYDAYDAGINAYVDSVNQNPTQTPAEFPALGITPTKLSRLERGLEHNTKAIRRALDITT